MYSSNQFVVSSYNSVNELVSIHGSKNKKNEFWFEGKGEKKIQSNGGYPLITELGRSIGLSFQK